MSRDRTVDLENGCGRTRAGSDVWVLSTPESARAETQKVPPQAQKVPLTVALTTAMTPWERHLAQL